VIRKERESERERERERGRLRGRSPIYKPRCARSTFYRVSNVHTSCKRIRGAKGQAEECRMKLATGIKRIRVSPIDWSFLTIAADTPSPTAAADCSRKSLPKANSNQPAALMATN
jgi:hypothetical protein